MERFTVTTCTRFTPEDRRALAAILRSQEKILSALTELTAAVAVATQKSSAARPNNGG